MDKSAKSALPRCKTITFLALLCLLCGGMVLRASTTLTSDAPGDTAFWAEYVQVTLNYKNLAGGGQTAADIVATLDFRNDKFTYVPDSVEITLPGSVTLNGAAANPVVAGNVLTWDIDERFGSDQAPLATNDELTIVFYLRIGCDAATTEFQADVDVALSADGARSFPGLYTLTVEPPSLVLALTPASQTVELTGGAEVTWTATVTNVGLGNANNIAVRFGLDASLPYLSGSATIGSIAQSGTLPSAPGVSIDGDSVTVHSWRLGSDLGSDPGAGDLADLDSDGEWDDLPPGGSFTIVNIRAQLQDCEPVGLYFDATTGFDGEACIDSATTDPIDTQSGFVSTRPAVPSFTYAFSGITGIDYCNGNADATFTITNPAGAGPVNNLSFTLGNFPVGIDFVYPASQGAGTGLYTVLSNLDGSDPQVLSGANAVTFDRSTGVLDNFPLLDSDKKITLTFDATSLEDPDAFCSNQALSRTLSVTPTYTDLCGLPYSPLPSSVTLSRDDPVRLRLTTLHGGTDEIFIGDTSRTYSINATYSAIAGDPWSQLAAHMPITLTYSYDQALVFLSSSGSGVYVAPVSDPVAKTLTWTGLTFNQLNAVFSANLEFRVLTRAELPCEAGREYSNDFTVEPVTLTDCLDCTYTIGGTNTFRGFINQQTDYASTPIESMDKTIDYINTLASIEGEACRPYEYTATVDFGGGATGSWSSLPSTKNDPGGSLFTEVVLIERPTQGQTFHELRSVIYNGTDYGPNGTGDFTNADVTTFGNGEVWLFLGKLDTLTALDPDDGHILEVVWEFDPPTTFGTKAEFSEIRWPTANSLCGSEFGYEHGVWVTVGEQTLDYDFNSPAYVLRGDVSTHTFTLSRLNEAHFAYDLLVTVDLDPDSAVAPFDLDYAYKEGTSVFSGFLDENGAAIAAFEPNVVDDTLVWDFRAHGYRVLQSVGSISMDLLTAHCEADPTYTVQVDYNRYCGYEAGTTPADISLALQTVNLRDYGPSLSSTTIPYSRTLYEESELWVLRFANNGNAPAWNAGLVATFGTAFKLVSAELITAAQAADPDAAEGNGLDVLQITVPPDPDSPQVWTFQGASFAADPDGADGLADADGDGIYDDLPSGAVAYILVRIDYDGCNTTDMSIALAGEAGGELPGTSYDPLPTPGDMIAARPAPAGLCCSCAGSTGTIRVAASVLQTIHVGPALELCSSKPLVFRSKNVRQGTIYEPLFRQFIPQASDGVIMDLAGATYSVDMDGDGTYELAGPLPAPTITPGAPGNPDVYVWTYDQFFGIFDDGLPFGAVVDLSMVVWGDCSAVGSEVTFGSQMDFTNLCGDRASTTTVQTNVTILDLEASVTIEARNISAGQTAWQTDDVNGGAGDQIEYRVTLKNDGGATIRNARLEATLPANFNSLSAITPAYTSRVGNLVTWDKDALLGVGGSLAPAAEEVVSFTATLDGTNVCVNQGTSISLELGCLANGSVGDCLIETNLNTHQLVTEPTLAAPEIAISGTDLIVSDGDSDAIDTNGIITITVTGQDGSAGNLVLKPTIPAEWLWDGTPGTVFTYTASGSAEPGFVAGITGCTVDATTPAAPVFTFTRGGVAADSFLRDGEVVVIQFYVVQNSAFDASADRLVATETPGNALDPAPPANLPISADLDFTDTCGTNSNTATQSETLTVDTPDLDVEITGDNPGIVGDVGDTLNLTVEVANNGENSFAENGVLEVTIGDAWDPTTIPAAFAGTQDLSDAAYEWVASGVGTEYYLRKSGGGDPGLMLPTVVSQSGTPLTGGGTPGALAGSDWGWGDVNGLGFSTVYVDVGAAPTLMTADVPAVTVPPTLADTRVLTVAVSDLGQASTDTHAFTLELADKAGLFTFEAHVEAPILRQDGVTDMGDYSFDTHAAALIGFTLSKVLVSTSETDSSGSSVLIGEEVTCRITAVWFGGQGNITDVDIPDPLPDGQGYVSHTVASGAGFINPSTTTVPIAVNEGNILWEFASIDTSTGAQTFQVDLVTRILNDAVDSEAAPNLNGATSVNEVDSLFTHFGSNYDSSVVGYPDLASRSTTVAIETPAVTLTKQVRNLTQDGAGAPFVDATNAVAGDTLEYRVVITHTDGRAPLYNLVVDDAVDAKLSLKTFASDGLDNDGDSDVDGADGVAGAGEGNDGGGGYGAALSFDETYNAAFAKMDGTDKVTLLYQTVVGQSVIDSEELPNTVELTYDTLPGATGSQSTSTGANGTLTGARVYDALDTDTVTVTVDAITTTASKRIVATSRGGVMDTEGPVDVVVGEEVRYRLRITMQPQSLPNWRLFDVLPQGLQVVEAFDVTLAGTDFDVGGTITPTITTTNYTNDTVTWDFGNRVLLVTAALPVVIEAEFIARVLNINENQNPKQLVNTEAKNVHEDATGADIVDALNDAKVVVREAVVMTSKSMSPDTGIDAGDIITVTVTVRNTSVDIPIYNVDIYDDLAACDLEYVGNIVGDSPSTVYVAAASPTPALPIVPDTHKPLFRFDEIATDAIKTFTFQARVASSLEPEEVINNNMYVAWTSLADNTVALNTGGTIGADGSSTGMRNGQIPGDAGLNDYELSTFDVATTSSPAVTKEDLGFVDAASGFSLNTIGARRKFRITIDLPEGTIEGLTIEDYLEAGGTGASWLLENDATYDISYTLTGIYSINGVTTLGTTGEIETAIELTTGLDDVPPDETEGLFDSWNFGTVVTTSENDTPGGGTISPSIVIEYYCRINNVLDTQAGDILGNTARFKCLNGEDHLTEITLDSATPTSTVVEPAITTLSKTVANITSPGVAPDAGDILEYTLTITNSNAANTSTAYDVGIVDALPAGVTYSSVFSATLNGVAWPGAVDTAPTIDGANVKWGRDHVPSDLTIDIAVGQSFILKYRVTVDTSVEPDQTLTNDVDVNWSSLDGDQNPGATTGERDGSDGAGGSPDDYAGSATDSTTSSNVYSIAKVRTSDTYDEGGDGDDTVVRVGDVVTYTVTATLQDGTADNLRIEDTLPAGLAFVSGNVVPGTNVTAVAATSPTAGDTGTITWDFGTVSNPAGDGNTITITYLALVDDIAAIPATPTSTDRTNSAQLLYEDAGGNAETADTPSDPTVTVKQPVLALTKTSTPAAGSTDLVQGQTVTYTITVTNNGDSPAYDPVVEDVVPVGMRDGGVPVVGDVTITLGGSGVAAVAPVATGTFANDGGLRWTLNTSDTYAIEPGESLVLVYDLTVDSDVGPGVVMANSASVSNYYSFDDNAVPADAALGDRRDYGSVGPQSVTLTTDTPGTLSKSATSLAAIGGTITYTIKVPADGNLVNATLYDVIVTDTLPANTTYASSSQVGGVGFSNANITVDGTLTFDSIAPNSQAVITLTATVDNVASNQTAVVLTNTARYTYERVDGQTNRISGGADATADTTIVEPAITAVTKTVANITSPGVAPDAGDILEYTLTVTNSGAAGTSTAYDVGITDTLPADVSYSSVESAVLGGFDIAGSLTAPTSTPAGTLEWGRDNDVPDLGIDIDAGESFVLKYRVTVDNTVEPDQTLTNAVAVNWSSLDGDQAPGTATGERDGSNGAGPDATTLNNYAGSDSVSTTSSNVYSIDKGDPSAATRAIGDTVTYSIVVNLPEGTTDNLVVTDAIPAGMGYVSYTLTDNNFGVPTSTTSTVDADGVDLVIRWASVTLAGDNNATNNDATINVTLRVLNVVGNQLGATLGNTASFTYDDADGTGTTVSDSTVPGLVTVLEPDLEVVTTITNPNPLVPLDAGDTVTYEIVIRHTGTSNADAYDVNLETTIDEIIKDLLVTSAVSISTTGTASQTSAAVVKGDATGVENGQYDIPLGSTVVISYTATVQNTVNPGNVMQHVADITWSSLDGNPAGARDGSDSVGGALDDYAATDSADAVSSPTTFGLVKSIVATSVADTADPNLAIGEIVTYQVVASVIEGTTNNLQLVDTLPDGFTFVSGSASVTLGHGSMTSGYVDEATSVIWASQKLTFSFGTVVNPAGAGTDTITIAYNVLVSNSSDNNAGNTKTNSATLSADGATDTTATTDVTIVEPVLTVTKTLDTAGHDAGDTVVYDLEIQNTGGNLAKAYDIVVSDIMDGSLTYVSATASGASIDNNSSADQTIDITLDELDAGATATVTITATVQDSVQPGEIIKNTVDIYWSSLDGGLDGDASGTSAERTGAGGGANDYSRTSAEVQFSIDTPTIDKSNPNVANAAVGDTVDYTIAVTLPEGTTNDLIITDAIPAGMGYVSHTLVDNNFGLPNSTTATVNGDGVDLVISWLTVNLPGDNNGANNGLTINLTLRVLNVAGNDAGDTLANTASLNYDNEFGVSVPVSDSTAPSLVTIVEPVVTVAKSASNLTHPGNVLTQAGDSVEYTLVLDASDADAFDLAIVDTLSSYLVYDATFTPTLNGAPIPAATVTGGDGTPGNEQTLSWDPTLGAGTDIDISAGGTATIVYRTTVRADWPPSAQLSNDADVYWSSQDGGLHGGENGDVTERTGSGSAYDDYTQDDTTYLYGTFDVTKTVVSGDPAVIGGAVSFRLVLEVSQGVATNVSIVDYLPDDVSLVSGSVSVTYAAGLSSTLEVTDDGTPGEIGFNFGTVTCVNLAPQNTITVDYDVLVENESTNFDGETKINSAFAGGDRLPNSVDTASFDIHEPLLTVVKEYENITKCGQGTTMKLPAHRPENGDTLRFTIIVANSSSTATAYDVDLTDMVGIAGGNWIDTASLSVESATLNGLAWGGDTVPTVSGTELNWGRGDGDSSIDIAPNENFELIYTIEAQNLTDALNLTRDTEVDWTSIDGASANERTGDGLGENDYSDSLTYVLYAYDSTPTAYTVAAGISGTLDADGNLDWDGVAGTDVTLVGGEEIVLEDGSSLEVSGDGLPVDARGYVNIRVADSAAAILRQGNDFIVDHLILSDNASLLLVNTSRAGLEIDYGALTMGVGSELVFPDDSIVTFGPASIQGSGGSFSNYATIRSENEDGGLTLIFACEADIDYVIFSGIDDGYVKFQGPTDVDNARFEDGNGTNPYVIYEHSPGGGVTWSNLAFRSDDGASQSIENTQVDANTNYIQVDGYVKNDNDYFGGDDTDLEPPAVDDASSGVRWDSPTPARGLVGAVSSAEAGGVLARWCVTSELGVDHYVLEAVVGETRRLVGSSLAKAIDFAGAEYELLDSVASPGKASEYCLTVVDHNGSRRIHSLGTAEAVSQAVLSASVASQRVDTSSYPQARLEGLCRDDCGYASDTPVQTGVACRAVVSRHGLYSVPADAKIWNLGKELPVYDGMAFVRSICDFHTEENVIWSGDLTISGTPGALPAPRHDGVLYADGSYVAISHYEEDQIFSTHSGMPPGPYWYFSEMLNAGVVSSMSLATPAASDVGEAKLVVNVFAKSVGNHDLAISLNGEVVGYCQWTGDGNYALTSTFPASLLRSVADNEVKLYTSSGMGNKYLDFVEIQAPSTPTLSSGELLVLVEGNADPADLFSQLGADHVWDVSEFGAEVPLPNSESSVSERLLYFANEARAPLEWSASMTLEAVATADWIALVADEWKDALESLCTLRAQKGLSASVVSIETVFDVYGSGIYGPAGIKRFSEELQPKYLLLAGGASYDHCGRAENSVYLGSVPSHFFKSDNGLASTDDLYAGEGYRTAVGRFPAFSREELQNMVDKTINFRPADKPLYLSTRGISPELPDLFSQRQDEVAAILAGEHLSTYELGLSLAQSQLWEKLPGASFAVYQGHGSVSYLGSGAGDQLLSPGHSANLSPSCWIMATCQAGLHCIANDEWNMIGRDYMCASSNGAVAILGSTFFGNGASQHNLTKLAMQAVSEGIQDWSGILRLLKTRSEGGETSRLWNLLGDPALCPIRAEGNRSIVIESPAAGEIYGKSDQTIDISIRLEGTWLVGDLLEIHWTNDEGKSWNPISEVKVEAEQRTYVVPWPVETIPDTNKCRIRVRDKE